MRSWAWRTAASALAAATVATVAGCSTVASSDLRTSGMTARIFVTAGASGIGVAADLTAGGSTSVELRPGDRLLAGAGGASVTLHESTVLGLHTYSGIVPAAAAPNTEVRVDLLRSTDPAASSTVRLPGAVGLLAPRRGASVSRGQDLPLHVAPGVGSIRVDWTGSCVGQGEARFERPSPLVVPAGSLRPPAATAPGGPAAPVSCNVTLTVSRVLEGTLASSYKGGVIEGIRSQAVVIRSVP